MILTLTGGTSQQRQWFEEAVRHADYPFDHMLVNVTVTWVDEPPCPGHKETACTTTADGVNFAITVRNTLDTFGRLFYEEIVVHELAHVITFNHTTVEQRELLCPLFVKRVSGEGEVPGTAADLNPLGNPWEDRIQEAMAEIIKDAIMLSVFREADNRTNWSLPKDQYDGFMTNFWPPGTGGEDVPTETIRRSDEVGHAHVEYDPGDNLDMPPSIAVRTEWANFMTALAPSDGVEGAKVRFRWYIPPSATFVDAVLRYDIWQTTAGEDGPSLIGGDGGLHSFPYTGLQQVVNAGDEGLIEFDYPMLADLTEGRTLFSADCQIWGSVTGVPVGEFWAQTSTFMPASTPPLLPPPWPYRDPFLSGGGGDTQVFRAR